MNEIDTALAEQSLFFVVGLLVLAAYLQAKIHKESTAVLGKLLDMKNDLREETKSLGTRLARVEGKFQGARPTKPSPA